jgi:uncharacterized membrane protein YhaH (DUF805 family)
MKDLSPIAWALRPLKRYAEFSGRSSRAEFWWFFLFVLILYVAMWFVMMGAAGGLLTSQTEPSAGVIGVFGVAGIFIALFWLAVLIPVLAVQVRRLHDTGRSGWWLGGYYLLYAAYMATVLGVVGLGMAAGAPPPQGSEGLFIDVAIIGLLFFVYSIVLLVLYCLPGTPGLNRYGPYEPGNLEEVFG